MWPAGKSAGCVGISPRASISLEQKKTKAFLQRIDQLQKKLGPEFVVLENILTDIDLKSGDGREIALIIQSLNQSCPE
jgi:hypothetical protein